ncbi:MAG: alginate lyase family protein [Planctomycetota bacterium]
MRQLTQPWWIAKAVGWENVPRRLLQAVRRRSGLLRRRLAPERFSNAAFRRGGGAVPDRQPALWRQRRERFLAIPTRDRLRGAVDDDAWARHVDAVCDRALGGESLYFSHWYARTGWPPEFNRDPVHERRWAVGDHWLDALDLLAGASDVKFVWEPSRLGLAWYFARAYARSGADARAEAFWTVLDAWVEQNPPERSIAWACGQEMTFRLMAALFGAAATLDSPAATPERLERLARLAWQTGRHVSININQARMQGNNHALSEAVGLWTVGLLFPELRDAARWQRRGADVLAAEVARQVYADGSYVQHSTNYHRVMMDDLLWATGLARAGDVALPAAVRDRLDRATNWLGEMMDPASGRVPNYGANDGANVLPLACCDYLDYRPTLQAASVLLHDRRAVESGPWDEKALWLTGGTGSSGAVRRPARERLWTAPQGGYHVLRADDSWAMTRCHTYRHRPSHADMLHVDLWRRGRNVLRDAGTYMYNCDQPWKGYFPSTAAHNTVEVNRDSQMTKGPRFLWFHWSRGRVVFRGDSPDGRAGCVIGEHDGYRREHGVTHRRTVCRFDETYLIIDRLQGSGRGVLGLRWRLVPAEWTGDGAGWTADIDGEPLTIRLAPAGRTTPRLVRGERRDGSVEGFESLYYGCRSAVPTVVCTGAAVLPATLVTGVWAGAPPADLPVPPDWGADVARSIAEAWERLGAAQAAGREA